MFSAPQYHINQVLTKRVYSIMQIVHAWRAFTYAVFRACAVLFQKYRSSKWFLSKLRMRVETAHVRRIDCPRAIHTCSQPCFIEFRLISDTQNRRQLKKKSLIYACGLIYQLVLM